MSLWAEHPLHPSLAALCSYAGVLLVEQLVECLRLEVEAYEQPRGRLPVARPPADASLVAGLPGDGVGPRAVKGSGLRMVPGRPAGRWARRPGRPQASLQSLCVLGGVADLLTGLWEERPGGSASPLGVDGFYGWAVAPIAALPGCAGSRPEPATWSAQCGTCAACGACGPPDCGVPDQGRTYEGRRRGDQ